MTEQTELDKQIEGFTKAGVGHVLSDIAGFRQTIEDPKSLMLDPENAMSHPQQNSDAIWHSLKTFGFRKSTVAAREDDRTVFAGNGVVARLIDEGVEVCPVVWIPARFTDDEAKAFAIADNQSARLAQWNSEQLDKTLKELEINDWNVEDLGFDSTELDKALADLRTIENTDDANQDDFHEDVSKEAISKSGDLWTLGNHRLLCGDCTDRADIEKLMDNQLAQCAFTSPPYAEQRKVAYQSTPEDEYVGWWDSVQRIVRSVLKADGSFFVNIKAHARDGERVLYVMDLVLAMCRKWDWRFVDEFAWVKPGYPGGFPNRFKNGFEPVYHFSLDTSIPFYPDAVSHVSDYAILEGHGRGSVTMASSAHQKGRAVDDFSIRGKGLALPDNVLSITIFDATQMSEGDVVSLHAASFPVRLPSFFVRAFSVASDIWLDPFLGSGTTLIACEQLNRRCFGMEIEPLYIDLIVRRFVKLTESTKDVYCERDGQQIHFDTLFNPTE